jgi:regulator of protease activity HflC (stomatin/prohibitin superfamily)
MASEVEMQATIFLLFIAAISAGIIGLLYFGLFDKPLYFLLLVLFALIIIYSQSSKFFAMLQEYERAVVFRFGRFQKVAGPGWLAVVPFIDSFIKTDLRVQTLEVSPQEVVTKDNIKLTLDAIVFLHVIDPKKAIIAVEDYEDAALSFIQANLRDVVGKLTLEQVISNIDQINNTLNRNLAKTAEEWGLEVDKIEIQSVELPPTVMEAMHKKRAATEEKFAQVQRAEAQKLTIDALQEAAGKLTQPTLHYLYLQSLQKMAEGKSSKIIFPLELSGLATALSAKMGLPYSDAQQRVVEKYQEKVKEGERPQSIIEELKRELDIKATKKSKKDFDFE